MNVRSAIFLTAGVLAGCSSPSVDLGSSRPAQQPARSESTSSRAEAASAAGSIDGYKRDAALRIAERNAGMVFSGRPQALLRSVVVLRYAVDARGNLLRTEVLRSNHDRETETTALISLRKSAPLPQPAPQLLRHGRLDVSETWLFNDDGRFQLRSIAETQMDE